MTRWAALVHGRTYEVDFRENFIVRPSTFDAAAIVWAKHYIHGTTRDAETLRDPKTLRQHPRWSVFKNTQYCVVGVTCMADMVSSDKIRDKEQAVVHDPNVENPNGRLLYVFLGYVAQSPFPPLPPMDVELFKPLYQFVRQRWPEKSYAAQKSYTSEYEKELPVSLALPPGERLLNRDKQKIVLWPLSYGPQLWDAVPQAAGPVSLCLGFAQQKVALEGPFWNATAHDVGGRREVPRSGAHDTRQNIKKTTRREADSLQAPKTPVDPAPLPSPAPSLWEMVSSGVKEWFQFASKRDAEPDASAPQQRHNQPIPARQAPLPHAYRRPSPSAAGQPPAGFRFKDPDEPSLSTTPQDPKPGHLSSPSHPETPPQQDCTPRLSPEVAASFHAEPPQETAEDVFPPGLKKNRPQP